MGKFHDTLAEFGATEGAVFPDGMFDALIAAVAEDSDAALLEANDLSSAKIAELSNLNAENNTLIADLKSKLYDAMASAAVEPEARETFEDPNAPDEDDADIDDLFEDSPDEDADEDDEDDEDDK